LTVSALASGAANSQAAEMNAPRLSFIGCVSNSLFCL
jgi:hypothetical protein